MRSKSETRTEFEPRFRISDWSCSFIVMLTLFNRIPPSNLHCKHNLIQMLIVETFLNNLTQFILLFKRAFVLFYIQHPICVVRACVCFLCTICFFLMGMGQTFYARPFDARGRFFITVSLVYSVLLAVNHTFACAQLNSNDVSMIKFNCYLFNQTFTWFYLGEDTVSAVVNVNQNL